MKGCAPGSAAQVRHKPGKRHAAGSGKRASVRPVCTVAGLCAALIAAGCASPSPSYADYRGKVQQTASAMISAVATG